MSNISQINALKKRASGVLADGTPAVISMAGVLPGTAVLVLPCLDTGVSVFTSVDNGVTYTPWPPGEVTAATMEVLSDAITHLKIQRTSGTGTQSMWSVTQDPITGPWASQQGGVKVLAVEP